MRKSNYRWQLTFTLLAIVVGAVMYFFFTQTDNKPVEAAVATSPVFGKNNYNVIKLDTFVALIRNTYPGAVVQQKAEEKILDIDIKIDKEMPGSFFNNNDALLQYKMSDYGFDIKYDPGEKNIKARFKIDEQNGVPVPNDVLLRLAYKINTTVTPNVDSTK